MKIQVRLLMVPSSQLRFQASCDHCRNVHDHNVEMVKIFYNGEPTVRFRGRCTNCNGVGIWKCNVDRWNTFVAEQNNRSYEEEV